MKIFLRPATSKDISILRHWDGQPHVLEAKNLTEPDAGWVWEVELNRDLYWRELLIGEVDNRPVAFLQIIDPKEEETHYWGDALPGQKAIDIWIGEKENLGRGYGTIMMQLALDRCFEDKSVTNVLIDPLDDNKSAHRFYERLGFRFVEQRDFSNDRCYVYELDRYTWEVSAAKQPVVLCSGGVLIHGENFLLGKRSVSASWYPEVWDVFGGHAECGEKPVDTLIREFREELSIVPTKYSLAKVFNYFEGSVHKKVQYHHFFVTGWEGEIQNCGTEHEEVRWFTRPELDSVPLAAKEYLALIDAWMQV